MLSEETSDPKARNGTLTLTDRRIVWLPLGPQRDARHHWPISLPIPSIRSVSMRNPPLGDLTILEVAGFEWGREFWFPHAE